MDKSKEKAILEAILFTMGDSVEIDRLADVIEEDKKTTKALLEEMAEEYQREDRGISLTTLDDAVQLCTKGELYEYLIKIAKTPKKFVLTDTLLETLSIIAYKQPVTRLEIEKIRGVSCDHAVNRLLEFDLITEVGRMDALTNVYNHKAFEEKCEKELAKGKANAIFLMMDVDDFKLINDTQGHNVGDLVLSQTGAILNEAVSGHGFAVVSF